MTTRFHFVDLVIDSSERTVVRGADDIVLTDLSFALLAELIKSAPAPMTSLELAVAVWRSPHVSLDTVAQRIRLLRRALGDNSKFPRYIKTIRGAGYVCASPVRKIELPTQRAADKSRWKMRRFVLTATVIVTIVVGILSLSLDRFDFGHGEGRSAVPSVAALLVERAQAQLRVQQADETDLAVGFLQRALELDPTNTRAQIALSFALSTRATKFRAWTDDVANAESMARSALASNGRAGAAWHALGYALDSQGRVDEALSAYRFAFELDPNDVAAMSSAAYLLSIRGHLYESLLLEAQAMEGKGYSRYADTQIAAVLDLVDHPSADHWRARSVLLNPMQVVVLAEAAESHLRNGNPRAAMRTLVSASDSGGWSPRLHRLSGRAWLTLGNTDDARKEFTAAGSHAKLDLAALDSLLEPYSFREENLRQAEMDMISGNSWPGLRVQVAELYAALGDNKSALTLIAQAVDLGWRDTKAIETSPFLSETVTTKQWRKIRRRVDRELDMQVELIESAPRLAEFLNSEDGVDL